LAVAKILLAIDGSEDSLSAARAASDICAGTGSELHVVHALEPLPRHAYSGLTPEIYTDIQHARERDARALIVVAVGSRGLGMTQRVRLGSVSTNRL